MQIGRLPEHSKLELEQQYIIERVSAGAQARRLSDQVLLIQGVAGSGKTTIALSVLRDFLENRQFYLQGNDALTPVLITYSDRLVESCHELLSDALSRSAENAQRDSRHFIAPPNTWEEGKVSLFSFTEFCRQFLPVEARELFLSDRQAVAILRRLASARNSTLLAEQIFGLITAFLKGHPDIRNRSEQELQELLPKLGMLTAQKQHIIEVRQYILKEYDERLQSKRDRADLAEYILRMLRERETQLQRIKGLTGDGLRTQLLKRDRTVRSALGWLVELLDGMADIPTLTAEMISWRETVNRSLDRADMISNSNWAQILTGVDAAVKQYGFRDQMFRHAPLSRIRNPVLLIDEVQDLSEPELATLVHLWFHQERNIGSRLLVTGDINQTITPTGFSWEKLVRIVQEAAHGVGERLGFEEGLAFRNAEEQPLNYPFLFLPNNYRTTTQIAEFAHDMMTSVIANQRVNWGDQAAQQLERNIVSHRRTLPIQIEQEITNTPQHELEPVIMEGEYSALAAALGRIRPNSQVVPIGAADRLIVLLGREGALDESLIKDRPIALLPLGAAKGLEFKGVVIAGLPTPTSDAERLDPDLLAQWYMAVTRSRIRLLMFLSTAELNAIREAGWNPPKSRIAPLGELDRHLEWVGHVKMEAPAASATGEYYLKKFRSTGDESWLGEAIRLFQAADDYDAVQLAREEGAARLESEGLLAAAREHYRALGNVLGEIRCLLGERDPRKFALAVELAEHQARLRAFDTAFVAFQSLWENTKDPRYAELTVANALDSGRLSEAEQYAMMLTSSPTPRRLWLLKVAAAAKAKDPARAFRCAAAAEEETLATESLERMRAEGRFDLIDDLHKVVAYDVDSFAHRIAALYTEGLAKEADKIPAFRCYIGLLRRPLEAAVMLRDFVDLKQKELYELGAFHAFGVISEWYRDGYQRWLARLRKDAPDALLGDTARLFSLASTGGALLDLSPANRDSVQNLVPRLLRNWQDLPTVRSEAIQWTRDVLRSISLIEPYAPIDDVRRASVEKLRSALATVEEGRASNIFAALDEFDHVLPDLAYRFAKEAGHHRFEHPLRTTEGGNHTVVARILREYERSFWAKKREVDQYLELVWTTNWRHAMNVYRDLGMTPRALERLHQRPLADWQDGVSILYPTSMHQQREALDHLRAGGGPVVTRRGRTEGPFSAQEQEERRGTAATGHDVKEPLADVSQPTRQSGSSGHDAESSTTANPGSLHKLLGQTIHRVQRIKASGPSARKRDALMQELLVAQRKLGEGQNSLAMMLLTEAFNSVAQLLGPADPDILALARHLGRQS